MRSYDKRTGADVNGVIWARFGDGRPLFGAEARFDFTQEIFDIIQ